MESSKPQTDKPSSMWPSYEWWHGNAIDVNVKISRQVMALLIVIFVLLLISIVGLSTFENKNYDPYGQSIRFLQSRDDTGSQDTSLEERKYKETVSQLTSTPEAPNFSEHYGIDASLKNGSVMIERENFENSPLSMSDLEKANKGY